MANGLLFPAKFFHALRNICLALIMLRVSRPPRSFCIRFFILIDGEHQLAAKWCMATVRAVVLNSIVRVSIGLK